jgi:thiol-disulfide isomerase/thioredoxin
MTYNVYYFSMDSCGPCKAFKPMLQKTAEQLGVQVNYINIDRDPTMTEKYGIMKVPTLIVVNNEGAEQYRHLGPLVQTQLTKVLSLAK